MSVNLIFFIKRYIAVAPFFPILSEMISFSFCLFKTPAPGDCGSLGAVSPVGWNSLVRLWSL